MEEVLVPFLLSVDPERRLDSSAMIIAQVDTRDLALIATKHAPLDGLIKDSSADLRSMEEEQDILGNLGTDSMIEECSEDVKVPTAVANVRSGELLSIQNVGQDIHHLDVVFADQENLTAGPKA